LAQRLTRQCLVPRQDVVEGRDRQMEKRGSSFPAEDLAPVGGREDKLEMETGCNRIQSSLVCLGTTTTIAAAVVITRASTRDQAKEVSTRVPLEGGASATTAKPSTTSTATRMEHVEGLTTVAALGAIQLAGATLAVEISNLLAGFQTTPGLTELAPSMVDVEIKQQQQLSCL